MDYGFLIPVASEGEADETMAKMAVPERLRGEEEG